MTHDDIDIPTMLGHRLIASLAKRIAAERFGHRIDSVEFEALAEAVEVVLSAALLVVKPGAPARREPIDERPPRHGDPLYGGRRTTPPAPPPPARRPK